MKPSNLSTGSPQTDSLILKQLDCNQNNAKWSTNMPVTIRNIVAPNNFKSSLTQSLVESPLGISIKSSKKRNEKIQKPSGCELKSKQSRCGIFSRLCYCLGHHESIKWQENARTNLVGRVSRLLSRHIKLFIFPIGLWCVRFLLVVRFVLIYSNNVERHIHQLKLGVMSLGVLCQAIPMLIKCIENPKNATCKQEESDRSNGRGRGRRMGGGLARWIMNVVQF